MIDFFLGFLAGLACFYLTLEVMAIIVEKSLNKYLKDKKGGKE